MQAREFAKRRQRLLAMLGNDSIAILPAAPERIRSRDVEHPYRSDNDFYYLTGFPEPEAIVALIPGRKQGQFVLFCRERDVEMETWHGRRTGLEGAMQHYGADDAFPIEDADDILPGLMENRERVFYSMGTHPDLDQRMLDWLNRVRKKARAGIHAPGELVSLDHLLHEMRLIKSAAEIRAMKKAAKVSAEAHCRAMQVCQPGMMEYQVEAEILHHFMMNGCRHAAYPSIVGGGENGCILHYTENESELQDGDLLLIDAGGEYDNYAADITRTFPVNGKFSAAQKALYELVLAAQYAAIEKVQPGNHWNDPHQAAVKVLTKGLIKLGLLKGTPAKLIKEEAYRRFYMHRTGHWLGMDVHDVGDYKLDGDWRLLEAGMVLTIEPGLYIAPGSKGVAKKWWGMGIRIEDDVRVTRTGHEVLTSGVPKEVGDIERLMAATRSANKKLARK
ncbi:MAG TPA: Xaa-Pro aminopeptidase [Candidatus Tenderia electrophaga]|uniref:Xaa-Pro aminopeptidase n=1 Tax=Candidatus Tenderia electrophaga TaxID=1748243 RepID=A0A832J844_9GAMM|nr:Xaa-Pro aminopeptidase [Candidatus Tenderia electrophaga]